MTRHSKNNTNAAVFSNAERTQLRGIYGTRMTRVELGSQRPYDSCGLCLKAAVIPIVCDHGHVFCKECVLEYLLKEKQRIRDEKWKVEEHRKDVLNRNKIEREAQMLKEVESFKAQNAIIPIRKLENTEMISMPIIERCSTKKVITCPLGNHQISHKRLYSVKLTKECSVCRLSFHNGLDIFVNLPCGDLCCKQCKTKDTYCPVCSDALIKSIKLSIERGATVMELVSPAPLFS